MVLRGWEWAESYGLRLRWQAFVNTVLNCNEASVLTGTATISSSEGSTRLDNRGIVVRVPAGNFSPLPNARPPLGHNQPPIQ
jgi:hypothetical protein